ncbi:HNH endonuclease [Sporolactobacillus laevolacticus]|uniref:HNH endonuclease n=1 Tax=Sporolactobacillus laevolacticus TaxID=33018 RepID=UPI0025B3A67E|nr:HNH endonuclease [Sporolactobacillus laevolacticus]MDN3953862.1 HNH endonuclease [Sporolactobacillus laevolacticus]
MGTAINSRIPKYCTSNVLHSFVFWKNTMESIFTMEMKICKGCNRELPVSSFCRSINHKDGLENKCKECRREQKKKAHLHICEVCEKEFTSAKKDSRYCSQKCYGISERNRVITKCANCGKEIEVIKSKFNRFENFYCNQKCHNEHLKGLMEGKNNPNYNRVEVDCSGCGKGILVIPYNLKNHQYHFCSYGCYLKNIGKFFMAENNSNYLRVTFYCSHCGISFERKPSDRKGKHVYCSYECYAKAKKIESEHEKERRSVTCPVCGRRYYLKPNELKNRKHSCCSVECSANLRSKLYVKEKHPNWDPNISDDERRKKRHYYEYLVWRKKVYERDYYTCKCCGESKGGNLVAHHIINYSQNKKMRTNVANGITLCKKCHKKFHDTYGYTNNNEEQIKKFIAKFCT